MKQNLSILLPVCLLCLALAAKAAVSTPLEQYQKGIRYEQANDIQRALYWYRLAADTGQIDAQLRLAKLYREGKKVTRDYAKSAHYYELAARQGDSVAAYKLGTMYYGGQGVMQDNVKAAVWFRRAAQQGLPEAIKALDVMRRNHHLSGVLIGRVGSARWKPIKKSPP